MLDAPGKSIDFNPIKKLNRRIAKQFKKSSADDILPMHLTKITLAAACRVVQKNDFSNGTNA